MGPEFGRSHTLNHRFTSATSSSVHSLLEAVEPQSWASTPIVCTSLEIGSLVGNIGEFEKHAFVLDLVRGTHTNRLFGHHHLDEFFVIHLTVAVDVGLAYHFVHLFVSELFTKVGHYVTELQSTKAALHLKADLIA